MTRTLVFSSEIIDWYACVQGTTAGIAPGEPPCGTAALSRLLGAAEAAKRSPLGCRSLFGGFWTVGALIWTLSTRQSGTMKGCGLPELEVDAVAAVADVSLEGRHQNKLSL